MKWRPSNSTKVQEPRNKSLWRLITVIGAEKGFKNSRTSFKIVLGISPNLMISSTGILGLPPPFALWLRQSLSPAGRVCVLTGLVTLLICGQAMMFQVSFAPTDRVAQTQGQWMR